MTITKDNTLTIKGIAILMMVIHHLWGWPNNIPELDMPAYLVIIGKACKLCVAIFMVLSGYGLAKSSNGNVSWNQQIQRVYKLYCNFWKIAIPFYTIGWLVHYYTFDMFAFCGNMSGFIQTYNREWWYIPIYAFMLLSFPFLYRLVAIQRYGLYLGLSVCVLSRFLTLFVPFDGVICCNLYYYLYYLSCFIIGLLMALYSLDDIFKDKKTVFLLEKISKSKALLIVFLSGLYFLRVLTDWAWITVLLVPLFILFCLNCNINNKITVCFLDLFGKYSMNIWLVHTVFIYYYAKKITFEISKNPVIDLGLVLLLSLFVAYLLEKTYLLIRKCNE